MPTVISAHLTAAPLVQGTRAGASMPMVFTAHLTAAPLLQIIRARLTEAATTVMALTISLLATADPEVAGRDRYTVRSAAAGSFIR